MIQIPGFRTVLRGYDPTEVDRAIGDLIKARDQARSEAADNALARSRMATELAELQEQAAGYRAKLAKVEAAAEAPASSDVGARIGRMLSLAEDEAAAMRTEAAAEAERLLAEAKAEVEQLTGNAERHARDVVSKADTEAARILEAARRQSDEIVDYADREAVARREEAESIYEAHRARAAAAADEFERNLGDRQRQADVDFASRTELHEQAITALLERQEVLQAEAEQAAERAREEARAILRTAREEAQQHLDTAHAEVAELRGQADRDLQTIVAKRDAVNAQLATVRQLLADLDTGPSTADPEPVEGVLAGGDPADEAPAPTDSSSPGPVDDLPIPVPDPAEGELVDKSPSESPAPAEDEPSDSETPAEMADVQAENGSMAGSGQR